MYLFLDQVKRGSRIMDRGLTHQLQLCMIDTVYIMVKMHPFIVGSPCFIRYMAASCCSCKLRGFSLRNTQSAGQWSPIFAFVLQNPSRHQKFAEALQD